MAQSLSPSLPDSVVAPAPSIHDYAEHQGSAAAASNPELSIKRRTVKSKTIQTDQQLDKTTTDRVEQTTERELHPTTQSSNERTIGDQKAPPPTSFYVKFGAVTFAILVGGTICILGALGFLWFLWLADYHNSTWQHIVYNNWFIRCVSLSGLGIRTAISLQSSAATSMIASLALEHTGVLLLHFASVSLTRESNGGPYMLAWWLLKTFIRTPQRWTNSIVPTLITALTIITIAIQFTTTALLSDVNSIVIPGPSDGMSLATNFIYNINGSIPVVTRGTTWTMKLPFYPIFAEYHEDVPDTPDGLSDTGLTLRAFVPLQDQQSRAQLQDFQGRATVLDSRVVCMRPNLTYEKAHVADNMLAFDGKFNAPFNASRLEYFTQNFTSTEPLADWNDRLSINFTCLAPLTSSYAPNASYQSVPSLDTPHWRLSFCQPYGLNSSGVLLSEFRTLEDAARYGIKGDSDPNYANGVAYLAINVSSGTQDEWVLGLSEEDSRYGVITGPGSAPLAYSDHGEWLDLLFSHDTTLQLSISLCYSAFDTADLDIVMSSSQSRTEPVPTYDVEKSSYTYDSIREQYGQLPDGRISYDSGSANARGILSLHKRPSWLPVAGDDVAHGLTYSGGTSWITDFGNMGGPTVLGVDSIKVGYDTTAFLYNAYREPGSWTDIESVNPDPSMISLVQEIVQSGGSVAFALQSIITSLASVAYYDQLQQFNDVNSITYSEFIAATARAKLRGLISVSAVIAVHLILMCVIICLFLIRVQLSTVGNSWQAVAQVNGELTKPLLETAAFSTGTTVEGFLQAKEWERKIVGITVLEDDKGTKIIGVTEKHATAASVTGP